MPHLTNKVFGVFGDKQSPARGKGGESLGVLDLERSKNVHWCKEKLFIPAWDWGSFEQKEKELLVFMGEIKSNRGWKTHQWSTALVPGGECANIWVSWGSGTPRPSRSSLEISQTSFKRIFLLLLNAKTPQSFGQDPWPEPYHARKETIFPQQVITPMPTVVARSPAVPSTHTSTVPPPKPLSRIFVACLELGIRGTPGPGRTLPGTLWYLPIPAKGTRDVIRHHLTLTHIRAALLQCPSALKIGKQLKNKSGENTQISDFLDNPDIFSLGLGVTLWQRQTPQFELVLALFSPLVGCKKLPVLSLWWQQCLLTCATTQTYWQLY